MKKDVKRRILFFQQSLAPHDGGVPRVSDIISNELEKRGYECYFVYYQKDNPSYPESKKLKVDFSKSEKGNEDAMLQFIRKNEINVFVCQNAYLNFFIKFYRKLRLSYPNLLFFSFLHASPDYWKKSFQLKNEKASIDWVKTVGKNLIKRIVYQVYNPYIKTTSALYCISDKFVLLSDSFHASFNELYLHNTSPKKLVTIPNPLTFDNNVVYDQCRAKQKMVLIVSRLEEGQKRISKALAAWQQITETAHDWKLYIVGSGPDEGYYKHVVEKNKIKNVAFEGYKSNVDEYYSKASIFLMTSIWEGLPMSLLEAQQRGAVPIAFDNFSAVHDVITDNENGFVIQNNNADKFGRTLLQLIQDDGLRERLSKNAQSTSQKFQLPFIIEKWEELLLADSST